jgi:Flp pilus assembly pilin Flp
MMQWIRDRMQRKGQSMVEFALILCLIAVVTVATLMTLGNQVVLTYEDIQEAVMNPSDPGATSTYLCPGGTQATLHGHKYHCQ